MHAPAVFFLLYILCNLAADEIGRSATIDSPIKSGASVFMVCHREGSSISAGFALQSETETVVASVKRLL